MNGFFIAAAVLAVAVGSAHSWLGERYILLRLFRQSDLPHTFGSDVFTKRTLRFAWHLTTVAWWGFAALLLRHAFSPAAHVARSGTAEVVAGTFFASALVSLVGARGRHLSWVVFLAIAVTAWLGAR